MATKGSTAYQDIVGGPNSQDLMFAFFDPLTTGRTVKFHTKNGSVECQIIGFYRLTLNEWVITGSEIGEKTNFKALYASRTRSGILYLGDDIDITTLSMFKA
jgi:hypothetical protein